MRVLRNIKSNNRIKKLQKELDNSVRKMVFCKLENAKSIGVIFDASKLENFAPMSSFINEISNNGSRVLVLGFLEKNDKKKIKIKSENITYFTRGNINWNGKSMKDNVSEFIDETFDILIDLSFKEDMAVKFLVAKSKAKFKVGNFSDKEYTFYDLTLKVSNDTENMFIYFLNQLKKYLDMIKIK